jgi:DNA-directed RNA polymerase specialized sigma24 family protein
MDHEQPDHHVAAPHSPNGDGVYQDLRPLPLSIAYRMVGSYSEAEDFVQEAFARFHEATRPGVQIESTKAFLTTVTTRLAIGHLRPARVRRESYVGPWLPDPRRQSRQARPPRAGVAVGPPATTARSDQGSGVPGRTRR